MASAIYPIFKRKLLEGSTTVDLDGNTIKARIVDLTADYTYSAAHDFLDDVTAYTGSTDQTLTSADVTLDTVSGAYAVFNAADVTYSSLSQSASKTVGAVVLYDSTGTASTSELIAYIELGTPVTPNGGNITISWEDGDGTYGDFILAI